MDWTVIYSSEDQTYRGCLCCLMSHDCSVSVHYLAYLSLFQLMLKSLTDRHTQSCIVLLLDDT